jgi:hypothetical protein
MMRAACPQMKRKRRRKSRRHRLLIRFFHMASPLLELCGPLAGGSTPGLLAGLLGVLGAPMSGPDLHPARPAADAAGSLAGPKQRFILRKKRSLPGHLRIAFGDKPKTPRRPPIPKPCPGLGRFAYGSFFIRLPEGQSCSGGPRGGGASGAKRSPPSASTEENVVPNHPCISRLPNHPCFSGARLPNHPLTSSRNR